jgi:hypothetical protein
VPRHERNGAVREADGALVFDGSSWAEAPNAWVREAKAADRLRLTVEARSSDVDQRGPARIVTVSRGVLERNLTVAQERDALVVRLRRAGSDANGFPQMVVPEVFLAGQWRTVEVEVADRRLRVRVDGDQVRARALGRHGIAWWDPQMDVLLGNETTLDRGWSGSLRTATVEVPSGQVDLLADATAETSRWIAPRIRFGHALQLDDVVLNVLGFVPVGILLRRRSLLAAVAVGLAISLTMELGQLFVPSRNPSVVDLAMNSAGAAAGWLLGRGLARSRYGQPGGSG